jgi:hypothetical protein
MSRIKGITLQREFIKDKISALDWEELQEFAAHFAKHLFDRFIILKLVTSIITCLKMAWFLDMKFNSASGLDFSRSSNIVFMM